MAIGSSLSEINCDGAWMSWAFLPVLAWAGVLAIASWPLYNFCRPHIGKNWTAAGLVLGLAVGLLVPIYILGAEATREAAAAIEWLQRLKASDAVPPEWLANIPLIGSHLSSWLRTSAAGWPHELLTRLNVAAVAEWGRSVGSQLISRLMT